MTASQPGTTRVVAAQAGARSGRGASHHLHRSRAGACALLSLGRPADSAQPTRRLWRAAGGGDGRRHARGGKRKRRHAVASGRRARQRRPRRCGGPALFAGRRRGFGALRGRPALPAGARRPACRGGRQRADAFNQQTFRTRAALTICEAIELHASGAPIPEAEKIAHPCTPSQTRCCETSSSLARS